jgi:plastocyanin
MRTRTLSAVLALLCAAACSGGGSSNGSTGGGAYGGSGPTTPVNDNPAPTSPNTINANPSLNFNPTYLTVPAGTTVTFAFGSIAHTITFTSPGSPADVPATSNASVNVVFPTAGTYNFHCSIHTYMTGYITVQ